jgi:hypothetical protein
MLLAQRQSVRGVVALQPMAALVDRVAPETRETSTDRAVDQGVDDGPQAIHPPLPVRVGEQVAHRVAEPVIRDSGHTARTEHARKLADRLRLVRIGDDHLTDQPVERCGTERQLLGRGAAHVKRRPAAAHRKRIAVLDAEGAAALSAEMAHLLAGAKPDIGDPGSWLEVDEREVLSDVPGPLTRCG